MQPVHFPNLESFGYIQLGAVLIIDTWPCVHQGPLYTRGSGASKLSMQLLKA
jgi:hypothetical protein